MPHSKPRRWVAAWIAVLAGAACLVVALGDRSALAPTIQAEEFQRLAGGLGLGPAVDLSRCSFSFDARLCPDCPLNHGPVPGGVYFCPHHACSILYCPPLARGLGGRAGEVGHGRAP